VVNFAGCAQNGNYLPLWGLWPENFSLRGWLLLMSILTKYDNEPATKLDETNAPRQKQVALNIQSHLAAISRLAY
jgi:hypothetical protein